MDFFEYINNGFELPFTTSLLTTTSSTPSMLGNSNIVSSNISSIIDLKPLAPVFLFIALSAIAFNASLAKFNFTPSISNNLQYCFVKEFLGSSKIFTKVFSSKSSKVEIIGSLPINSGINPNFNKSSGSTSFNTSPVFFSALFFIVAPNPIELPSPLKK